MNAQFRHLVVTPTMIVIIPLGFIAPVMATPAYDISAARQVLGILAFMLCHRG